MHVAQCQRVQHVRQIAMLDDEQPVGLAHLAGGLGEVSVRPGADTHLDDRRDLARDGLLDAAADGFHGGGLTQVVWQPGPHFIDAEHGLHMDAVLHGLHHPVVVADVFRRLAFDDGDTGAEDARLADAGAGFHTEGLGFVGGGDAARAFRHHRGHTHRPTAQRRIKMLLDRCEIRIAIDKQSGERSVHGRMDAPGKPSGQW